jgi:uncharacterized coiled-coil DUF342 family protein
VTSENSFEEYRKKHNEVTWKEYVDLRFEDQDRALKLSRDEMNRRLESMNEIRSQLDKQAGTFLTKETFDASEDKIVSRIATMESALAAESARNKVYVVLVSAAVSALIAIALYFLTQN